MKIFNYLLIGVVASFLLSIQSSVAGVILYESLPTANSQHISKHGVGGPVLADDFKAKGSGLITRVEWWGSAPVGASLTNQFELTFHSDANGVPSDLDASGNQSPFGGLSQHFVNALGTDADGDGIWHYAAAWNPADLWVTAGTSYWFSVANASGTGWTWALGAPPTIGNEMYDAVVSTGVGPNGGPHFGPWNGIQNVDFAFRIIPEPTSMALLGLGLAGMLFFNRRRYHVV